MRDRERERERKRQGHRQREKQAPCGEPDMGFDPGSPGLHPGPKAGAKPLHHPGIPRVQFLNTFIDILLEPQDHSVKHVESEDYFADFTYLKNEAQRGSVPKVT